MKPGAAAAAPALPIWTPLWHAALPLVIALAVAVADYLHDVERGQDAFQRISLERAAAAQAVHAHVVGVQAGIAAYMGLQGDDLPGRLDAYMDQFTGQLPVRARLFGYVREVSSARRAAYEKAIGPSGKAPPKGIWEYGETGVRIPASGRERYYPIAETWPDGASIVPLHLDYATIPERAAHLQAAAREGRAVASRATKRVSDPDGPYVYVITVPVYAARGDAGAGRQPTGYVFATYVFGEVYEHVLTGLPVAGVRLYIFDSDAPDARPVYLHQADYRGPPKPASGNLASLAEIRAQPWHAVNPVRIADRTVWFATVPESPPTVWQFIDAIAIGSLAAGLVASVFVFWNSRRRQHAQHLIGVEAATYRQLIETTGDGFATLDAAGRVIDWSPSAARLLGRSADAVRGLALAQLLPGLVLPDQLRRLSPSNRRSGPVSPQAQSCSGELVVAATGMPLEYAVSVSSSRSEAHYFVFLRDISERHEAEETFRQYQRILDASPNPIIYVSPDFRYRLANTAYLAMVGRSSGEVVGQSLQSVVPADILPMLEHSLQSVMGGESHRFRLNADFGGVMRKLEVIQVPYLTRDGKAEGAIVAFHDITDLQQLVSDLESAAQRYRNLFEESPVLYLHATEGHHGRIDITLCNETAITVLGYSRANLLATDLKELFYADYPLQLDAVRGLDARGGYCFAELVAADGELVPVLYRVTADPGREGRKRFRLAILDIRSETNLRRALTDSEEQFQRLVESLPQHVWVTDSRGELTYVSPSLVEFLGTGESSIAEVDARFWGSIHPEDVPALQQLWASAMERPGLQGFRGVFRLRRWDGEYRWMESAALPVSDVHGVVARWIGTDTDVTERRLTEERLQNSQKMEAIGQLTGGLAHDFNNLLGIVIGNLDMLLLNTPSEEFKRRLQVALNAADRGAVLVKSLLSVARRQTLSVERVNLGSLMQRLLPLITHSAGKQIAVACRQQGEEWEASIDVIGLESAILNLVINARDAMPDGGHLQIDVVEANAADMAGLSPGLYAAVVVRDDGPGMAADILHKATEPFFTTKERGHGTGLGLSMTKGFAEQSGGALHLRSAPDEGTEVRIVLPVTAALRPASTGGADNLRSFRDGRRLRVMVVDDEVELGELLAIWLADAGYEVLRASSADEAIAALDDAPVDLLISDIVMPGTMNGVALALHAVERMPAIKVMLVSGFADGASSTLHDLPWPLLPKPYRRSEVFTLVEELLAP